MRIGTAHDVSVHHVGQVDIVDVVASALDEAQIFFALDGVPHATDLRRCWEDHVSLLAPSCRRHTALL